MLIRRRLSSYGKRSKGGLLSLHTTLEMLNTLNPNILTTPLSIGQKVKIQKATMQKTITAWATINA
jgi:hypothetical protein